MLHVRLYNKWVTVPVHKYYMSACKHTGFWFLDSSCMSSISGFLECLNSQNMEIPGKYKSKNPKMLNSFMFTGRHVYMDVFIYVCMYKIS